MRGDAVGLLTLMASAITESARCTAPFALEAHHLMPSWSEPGD